MGIQFLLFAAIDLGIGILLERQRGLWKRLRSAPISRLALLGGKATSGTLISLMSLLVSFGFAIVVFGVRIQGSVAGFLRRRRHLRAHGGDVRPADRVDREDAQCDARRRHSRRADDGDARRRLGADVRLPARGFSR